MSDPAVTPMMEQMAIAVLRGDLASAHALADLLLNEVQVPRTRVLPIRSLDLRQGKVRVVCYLAPGVGEEDLDFEGTRTTLVRWLDERQEAPILYLMGIDRVEFYKMAE